jgi:6,7-dimethyl-8-ribityllumazine synthase
LASQLKNLSSYSHGSVPSAAKMRFGIVVSEWNEEVTNALYDGARNTLLKFGALPENIVMRKVPGSFELTLGAKMMAQSLEFDAIICIGCVIQGETRHFDFICSAVANGITELNIMLGIPVVFGVLTPENQQQALDRAGGKHGNKGDEAAITAIKMVALQNELDPMDDDEEDEFPPLNIVN